MGQFSFSQRHIPTQIGLELPPPRAVDTPYFTEIITQTSGNIEMLHFDGNPIEI